MLKQTTWQRTFHLKLGFGALRSATTPTGGGAAATSMETKLWELGMLFERASSGTSYLTYLSRSSVSSFRLVRTHLPPPAPARRLRFDPLYLKLGLQLISGVSQEADVGEKNDVRREWYLCITSRSGSSQFGNLTLFWALRRPIPII